MPKPSNTQSKEVPEQRGDPPRVNPQKKSEGFNFIPGRYVRHKERRSVLRDVNVYAAAAIVLLIAIAAALVGAEYYFRAASVPKRNEVADKWNQAVSMRAVEWKASAISERLETLNLLATEEIDLFAVLADIERTVSVDFVWERMVMSGEIELSARLTSMEDGLIMLHEVSQMSGYSSIRIDGIDAYEPTMEISGFVLVKFTVGI